MDKIKARFEVKDFDLTDVKSLAITAVIAGGITYIVSTLTFTALAPHLAK